MFGRGKEEIKKKGNSFSLSGVHMQRVQELAQLFGVSPSEIIRRAIDEYYMTTMERFSRFRDY